MKKGFARALAPAMMGGLFLLALPGRRGAALPAQPAWWEIRLTVDVKGDYAIKGGEAAFQGAFTCRAEWGGTVERDGDDFLLYRLKSETLDWKLTEEAAPPGQEPVEKSGEASERPLLRLNYVLREGGDLRFDYEFREVSIPLHASSMKVDLEFPRSSGQSAPLFGASYDDFVRRGSNRVVIPASDLERRSAERTFSWEFRREKRVAKDSRVFIVTQRHTAGAVVKLVAH